MKILILASVGCKNLGDELILKNEIKILKQKYSENSKFIVFSYDKKNPFFKDKNIIYKNYFPNEIKKGKNILKNIFSFFAFLFYTLKSNLIIIGGGGLIYDNENQNTRNPLDLWIFRTKIARLFRKKIYFFRIGIDIKKNKNLKKLENIFKKAYKIEVRDKKSMEILRNLGIESELKKDPVFLDSGKIPEKTSCFRKIKSLNFSSKILENLDLSDKTIGIAFRSGYLVKKSNISSRIEEGILKEILLFLEKSGAKIILLPHSFHKKDKKANDYDFLKKFSNNSIKIKENMSEVYEVYKNKKIDLSISMRLHSMILCEVYKIPYIGVSYSNKTDEVLKIF